MAKCLFPSGIGVLALVPASALPAAAQSPAWIRQLGGSGVDQAYSLAADPAGGLYVGGFTTGSLGGPSAGSRDAWLARYSGQGTQTWIRQFGTPDLDSVNAVAPDGQGGTFIAGWTYGSLSGTNQGSADAYLARYDASGNQVWLRQIGTTARDLALALAWDGALGAYVGGSTTGNLGGPSSGGADAWVARYDSAGEQLWVRQFGATGLDPVYALAADGAGGVLMTGETYGDLGGPSSGADDVWVARYDGAGTRLWISQFGSNREDFGYAIAPDGGGGAFVAGTTSGNLNGSAFGGTDAWVARLDASGNRQWLNQFGSELGDSANSLSPYAFGGVLVAGDTQGSLGGPSAGGYDAWYGHIDGDGVMSWVRQLGSAGDDFCFGVAANSSHGSFFVGGTTTGSLGGPSGGASDAWVARIGPVCYPNCDGSTIPPVLNVADFACFLNAFGAGDDYANCDGSTGAPMLTIQDFACFLNRFAPGCT